MIMRMLWVLWTGWANSRTLLGAEAITEQGYSLDQPYLMVATSGLERTKPLSTVTVSCWSR